MQINPRSVTRRSFRCTRTAASGSRRRVFAGFLHPHQCDAAQLLGIQHGLPRLSARLHLLRWRTQFRRRRGPRLAGNENLFVAGGNWDEDTYLPAYVRRYPFCMSRVTLDSVEQADRLVCVEKSFLADDGERMFDDAGAPLERWRPLDQLLNEYEADLERSKEMCAILADYALLEPFTLQRC